MDVLPAEPPETCLDIAVVTAELLRAGADMTAVVLKCLGVYCDMAILGIKHIGMCSNMI